MFRFAHIGYLNFLYFIPVIIFAFWLVYYQKKKILNRLFDAKLHDVLLPERSVLKYILKSSLIIIALIFLIISLANPQVGTKFEEVKQTGIDVFILLDVSLSMKAEDVKPNRLDRAKHSISELIDKLRGDRIGLVIFSGDAYIQFPLTSDYGAANLLLNAVNIGSVPNPGTAIASAINLASKSFNEKAKTEKVIVLITDGEDHEGDVSQAVKEAVEHNIRVFSIGMGTQGGAPIPLYNSQGVQTGYKLDQGGKTVISHLDDSVLQQIAEEGKGKYYRSGTGQDELQAIYNDLSKIQKTEYGTTRITTYEDRFYYFLAPAIFLLILEFFISEKRSRLFTRFSRKLGIK